VTTYWDTSAAINAAVSPEVSRRLETGNHIARLHLLAEFFATMTGRGLKIRHRDGKTEQLVFAPNECAAWLRRFAQKVEFEELTEEEALKGLENAQSLNVQGARVYDYWHALVSAKAQSDELVTRNSRDFEGFAKNVVWP
jgi:hypothetical protein